MFDDRALRELKILAMMNHPNVIGIYEYFESSKFISVILNNVKGKTLLRAIADFKNDYTPKRILKILMQLCRAVRHLKAKNIIWCNFHHENIIYDGENAVICGFSRGRVKVSRTKKIDPKILGLKGKRSFISVINKR